MSDMILNAEVREKSGKADARRLRRTGRVPAVIYGEIEAPASATIDAHDLNMLLREKHAVIDLSLNGDVHRVIVRDVQYHPVNGNVLHVDFMEVKKGQKIVMSVPVRFEGKPKGVKEGGMLDIVKHEVSISVLPKDIPGEIVVNIDDMAAGDAIRVEDLPIDNIELLDEPNDVLCRVAIPRGPEEEGAEEEELEGEEMAEPEVITARDKEDSDE